MMFHKSATACLKFILILCILSVTAVLAAAYETGEYFVAQPRVGVYSTYDSSGVLICELYGGTSADVVNVTQIENDMGKVYIASENRSGWVEMSALQPLSGTGSQIASIAVTPPTKLSYVDGEEEFDVTGLHVYAVNKNGTKSEITGYEMFIPSLSGTGKKTVFIYYTPTGGTALSASFSITVTRVPAINVQITKQPYKLSYIENQTISLDGVELTVAYSDGRADRVFNTSEILASKDFIFTCPNGVSLNTPLTAGTHKITVAYKYSDISAVISVNVRKRALVSFTATRLPDVAAYYSGEGLVIEGIELLAKYDNGESEIVQFSDCTVEYDNSSFVIGGNSTVILKYAGGSLKLNIEVKLNELIGVEVTPPTKTAYKTGEKLDTTGLVLTGVYNSGVKRTITEYTISETAFSVAGVHTIFVSCGEYSAPFTVTVSLGRLNGDADGDGAVSAGDARIVLRLAVKLETVKDTEQFSACDVDNDKTITAADARLVLRAAVKLEDLGWK